MTEMVRWALDRHRAVYLEEKLPFRASLWRTLDISDKASDVPLLVNDKREIFTNVTDILVYLYSQAFSGKIRLYSNPKSLDLQQKMDRVLYPATRTIFLSQIVKSQRLTDQLIHESMDSPQWKQLSRLTWPWLKIYLAPSPKQVAEAWQTVESVFEETQDMLMRMEGRYLLGSFSALDLALCSHLIHVLVPETPTGIKTYTLEDVDPEMRKRIERLRESTTGAYCLRVLKEERGELGAVPRILKDGLPWNRLTLLNLSLVVGLFCALGSLPFFYTDIKTAALMNGSYLLLVIGAVYSQFSVQILTLIERFKQYKKLQ